MSIVAPSTEKSVEAPVLPPCNLSPETYKELLDLGWEYSKDESTKSESFDITVVLNKGEGKEGDKGVAMNAFYNEKTNNFDLYIGEFNTENTKDCQEFEPLMGVGPNVMIKAIKPYLNRAVDIV